MTVAQDVMRAIPSARSAGVSSRIEICVRFWLLLFFDQQVLVGTNRNLRQITTHRLEGTNLEA